MNESEIKIELFHQIDSLGNDQLMELYGIVKNFINKGDDSEEWNNLSAAQKNGLKHGIYELEEGKGIEHNLVMEELKKKYGIF